MFDLTEEREREKKEKERTLKSDCRILLSGFVSRAPGTAVGKNLLSEHETIFC